MGRNSGVVLRSVVVLFAVSILRNATASAQLPLAPPSKSAEDELSAPAASLPGPHPITDERQAELSVEALVQQVLAVNPSVAQLEAAQRVAAARYPQVSALEDPMVGATAAPASFGSPEVEFGYRLEFSQKYPFPGKLALRGRGALAEASAAGHDVDDVRLQLRESAQAAFYDYYLVGRALAVNGEAASLLGEFRDNARARYETGLVPQQDVLQADLELARQRERQLTLERMQSVAVARINTLLHRSPETPLPSAPARLLRPEALPEGPALRALALARRPDLQALSDRLRADEAAIELAEKEFRPDFEVTAAYDTIMGNGPTRDLAPQIGVRMNLPVRKARRCAALAEARAKLWERRAMLEKQLDQVSFQVQEGAAQIHESAQAVRLYDETILPTAEANVKAAQSAYVTGKASFLNLIEAERNVIMLRDRRYEAIADLFRRRAALERTIGGPLLPAATSSR